MKKIQLAVDEYNKSLIDFNKKDTQSSLTKFLSGLSKKCNQVAIKSKILLQFEDRVMIDCNGYATIIER